jgi:zinc-ribbon domain
MRRRLFRILSALSLLLCLAALPIWIRSYWVGTAWTCEGNAPHVSIFSNWGRFALQTNYGVFLGEDGWREYRAYQLDPIAPYTRLNSLGFSIETTPKSPSRSSYCRIMIPFWFICLVTAIPPYLWLRSYRRNHLAKLKGFCSKCGYDLRASKERCPECGTPIPVQAGDNTGRT